MRTKTQRHHSQNNATICFMYLRKLKELTQLGKNHQLASSFLDPLDSGIDHKAVVPC